MLSNRLLQTLKITLLNIDFVQLGNSWDYTNIVNPFSRLYYIKSGEGWVYHNQKKIYLKADNLYLIPAFALTSYYCPDFMEQYYIHFTHDLEGGLNIYDIYSFDYECVANKEDIDLVKRLFTLNPNFKLPYSHPDKYKGDYYLQMKERQENAFNNPRTFLENKGILLQLFSRFFKKETPLEFSGNYLSKNRLTSTLEYIMQNLDKKITLKELSREACLSEDYFSRLFLQTFGIRPIEFINRKRIEKAQLLLLTTQLSQENIAIQVGFTDISYFSRLFKKYTKVTPMKYQRMESI